MRAVFVLVASLLSAPSMAEDRQPVAPAFQLTDALGNIVRFQPEQRERPALILFWATWCSYCKELMPEVQAIRDEFSRDELDVYAISVWEDGDPIGYMADQGYDFTLLLNGESAAASYGLKGTPGLILTGEGGEILYVRPSGSTNDQLVKLAIEGLIDQELADGPGSGVDAP